MRTRLNRHSRTIHRHRHGNGRQFHQTVSTIIILFDNVAFGRCRVSNVVFNRIRLVSTTGNFKHTRRRPLTPVDRRNGRSSRGNRIPAGCGSNRYTTLLGFASGCRRLTGRTNRPHHGAGLISRRSCRSDDVVRDSCILDNHVRPSIISRMTDDATCRPLTCNRGASDRAPLKGKRHKDRTIIPGVTASNTHKTTCPVPTLHRGVLEVAILEGNCFTCGGVTDKCTHADSTYGIILVVDNGRIGDRKIIDDKTRLARPCAGEEHIRQARNRLIVTVHRYKRIAGIRNPNRRPRLTGHVDVCQNIHRHLTCSLRRGIEGFLKREVIDFANLCFHYHRLGVNRNINTHICNVTFIDDIRQRFRARIAFRINDRTPCKGGINILLTKVDVHLLIELDIGHLRILIEAELIVVAVGKGGILDCHVGNRSRKRCPPRNDAVVDHDVATVRTIKVDAIRLPGDHAVLEGDRAGRITITETIRANDRTTFNQDILRSDSATIARRIIHIDILDRCTLCCDIQRAIERNEVIPLGVCRSDNRDCLVHRQALIISAEHDCYCVAGLSRCKGFSKGGVRRNRRFCRNDCFAGFKDKTIKRHQAFANRRCNVPRPLIILYAGNIHRDIRSRNDQDTPCHRRIDGSFGRSKVRPCKQCPRLGRIKIKRAGLNHRFAAPNHNAIGIVYLKRCAVYRQFAIIQPNQSAGIDNLIPFCIRRRIAGNAHRTAFENQLTFTEHIERRATTAIEIVRRRFYPASTGNPFTRLRIGGIHQREFATDRCFQRITRGRFLCHGITIEIPNNLITRIDTNR